MPPDSGDPISLTRLGLCKALGQQIENAEEGALLLFSTSGQHISANWMKETFLVFSHEITSENLGVVDSTASSIDVAIGPHDFSITQSPGLLRSGLDRGTTGAVLWKVTPLVAAWLIDKENFLWKESILTTTATVVELGCGVSGLIGLPLAPSVTQYILTDQPYVMKLLRHNITVNQRASSKSVTRKGKSLGNVQSKSNLEVATLDWEFDSAINVRKALGDRNYVSLLVACDCIYNDFLIQPFTRTCLEICTLQSADQPHSPTVVLIAQQLRSHEVFQEWLGLMKTCFNIWRVPDEYLSKELRSGSGFVVHLALKKEEHEN